MTSVKHSSINSIPRVDRPRAAANLSAFFGVVLALCAVAAAIGGIARLQEADALASGLVLVGVAIVLFPFADASYTRGTMNRLPGSRTISFDEEGLSSEFFPVSHYREHGSDVQLRSSWFRFTLAYVPAPNHVSWTDVVVIVRASVPEVATLSFQPDRRGRKQFLIDGACPRVEADLHQAKAIMELASRGGARVWLAQALGGREEFGQGVKDGKPEIRPYGEPMVRWHSSTDRLTLS